MATDPWAAFEEVGAAPAYPGVIPGRPKVATPLQESADARAQRNLEIAEERLALSQQSEARQAQTAAQGTESERTAGFLAGRLVDGVARLSTAVRTNPEAAGPTLGVEAGRWVFGDTFANYLTEPERQAARAAQIDIIDAALTLGTGAAYTREQLEGYREAYFPALGDDESTVKSKREALRSLIENAQTKAGRAAPDIGMALSSIDALNALDEEAEKQGLSGFISADQTNLGGPDDDGPPRFFGQFGEFMDDFGAIGKQGLSLGLSDEAAGIGGAIASVLKGGSVGEGYTRARDAERTKIAGARDRFGWGGTALEIAAGGGAGKVTNALSSVASAARQGAGFGALGGFGYGEGAASVPGAALGALTGFGIGAGFQKGANALAARRAGQPLGPTPEQASLIATAERQKVPLRQPDVRPELRGNFGATEQSVTGGPMIREAIASDREAVAQGVRSAAPGTARDEFVLGTVTQNAARRTGKSMKSNVDALYKRARQRAGDAVVPPTKTIASIDARIANLRQTGESANSSEVAVLEGIKSDLSKSGLTIDSLQAQRKTIRDRISQAGMDPDKAEAGFMDLMKEAANELAEGLPDQAKGALKTAETAYIERRKFQDEIARQFLGTRNSPIPPERAATRFLSMVKSKGDYSRFSRMFGELDDLEKGDFAATIAEGLGTKSNGEFEYGKFLRDLEQVNPRALRDVFGQDGVAALNDLRVIARAKSDTLAEKNSSRTGGVVQRVGNRLQGVILTAFGAGVGGVPGAVAGGVASTAMERFSSQRAARMLLNPDFTKWLRQTPSSTSPQVINRHFERLNQIAARSGTQSLQSDARALQDYLTRAFSEAPTLAAAEGQQEDKGR